MSPKQSLARIPKAEQWAKRIIVQHRETAESMIETGRLLLQAKKELGHGEWGRMFEERLIPFRQRWAEMFMAVASNRLLSNSHDRANLPPALGTLYDLTRADQEKLKNALKDGIITPDMKRSDIKALMPRTKQTAPDTIDVEPITKGIDDKEATAVRVALQPVRDLVNDWPDERSTYLFPILIHEVRQLLKQLERAERLPNVEVSA